MITFLEHIKATLTDNYYWYEVRFIYKDKSNMRIFDFTERIGHKKKHYVLNDRITKKAIEPLHKSNIPKSYLQNGSLAIEILSYLGKFPKIEIKQKG